MAEPPTPNPVEFSLSNVIQKRAVFFIGGYDPKSPVAFYERLDRESSRFEEVWGTQVGRQETRDLAPDITQATYNASGEGWRVETDFHFLGLDDIVLTGFQAPLYRRLMRYAVTFGDYIISGTAFKFLRHAWRFAIYFFYPAMMALLALAISSVAAGLIGGILPVSTTLIWPATAFLAFVICVRLGGERYHVLHLMDLWSFSRDFARDQNPQVDEKLNRFSELALRQIQNGDYSEVLLVGHSTGGALILDVAGRMLEKQSEIASDTHNLAVVTVGSTALKIGLHPAANHFRERVSRIHANAQFKWFEFQCLTDIINFIDTDPAKLMGIAPGVEAKPIVNTIRIKRMVSPDAYKRMKGNFFRVHYQFVFGNNLQYYYDFPGICFGPSSLPYRLTEPGAFMDSVHGYLLSSAENS